MQTVKICLGVLITGLLIFSFNPRALGGSWDYKEITAPEVRKLIGEGGCILVHVLSKIEYEMQHIPGSINIPVTEMQTTTRLPHDKNTPIVFYCMGSR